MIIEIVKPIIINVITILVIIIIMAFKIKCKYWK